MKIGALALNCFLVCGLLCLSCADVAPESSINLPVTTQPAATAAPAYDISLVDPLYESTAGAKAVAVGDVDNDGALDFASVSSESQRVQIHLQKGLTGEFDTIAVAGGAPITLPTAVQLADLNGDGKLDIIVLVADTGFAPAGGGSAVSGALTMLFQGADPRKSTDWYQIPSAASSPPANLSLPGGDGKKTGPTALLVGPLDNYYGVDIAVVCNGDDSQVLLFSNPGGDFAKVESMWAGTPIELDITEFAGAGLSDLDNDGDLDIALSVPAAKSFNLRWLENPLISLNGTGGIPTYVPDPMGALFEPTARAQAVVLGDLNNDNLVDVASISGTSQPVQIHLRDATTGLFKSISLASGPPLQSVADIAVEDLNGDGKLDLVLLVANTGLLPGVTQPALVLMIQGADASKPGDWTMVPGLVGSFPRNLLFGNNVKVSDLAIKDVDGALGPDIMVATQGAIRLFRHPGNALVTTPTAWISTILETNASDKAKVDIADVDADGDADVLIADSGGSGFNMRWLENPLIKPPGANTLIVPTYLSDLVRPDLIDPLFESTAGAKAVSIGDINGDGALDVASISDENQAVQIHLRDPATGKFGTAVTIAGGGPLARMNDVQLIDLNNDTKLDIVVLATDSGFAPPPGVKKIGALVLLIQGANPQNPANWTRVDCTTDSRGLAASPFYFLSNATGLTDMVAADFTGDGLADIVVLSNEDPPLPHTAMYLFTNPGAANVTTAANWNRVYMQQDVPDYGRVAAADIDEDGDLDIIASVPTSKTFNLRWMENNGNGTVWTQRLVGQQQGGGEVIDVGDIDRDGHIDVAVGSATSLLVQWFRNPGPAALATGAQFPWAVFNIGELKDTPGAIDQVRLVDLNNDGKLDCFVSAYDSTNSVGTAVGFQSQTDIQDTWEMFQIDSNGAQFGRVGFADFDGNGRVDFLAPLNFPGLTNDRIAFYTAVVDGRWLRKVVGQQDNGANFMAVGDIDKDGNPDVAVSSTTQGLTQWFRNPGPAVLASDGGQVPWKVYNIGLLGSNKLSDVQLVDLDGHGILDCVVTAEGMIAAFRPGSNPQDEWQGQLIDQVADATVGRMAFADLTNDGLADFITPLDRAGTIDDRIVVYTLVARNQWFRRLIGQQPGSVGTLAIADVDGDGNMDVACSTGKLTQWFRNPGTVMLQAVSTQVPWDVFNIGEISEGSPSQVQLVDLDSDGVIRCFVSGGGKAWGFSPGSKVENFWTPFPVFTTKPVAEVGTVGFGDFNRDSKLDFVAPIDRVDALVRDQFILFLRK